MARRILGAEAARELAACPSLPDAQQMLQPTPFRAAAESGLTLAGAQHAIAETILWDLRVLAGWLPRDGVSMLRLLAGWFEIANVDELLQTLAGRPSGPVFQLGALATAWPRLCEAHSVPELRHVLGESVWGDPGGDSSHDIRLAMRVRWAARVAASSDRARTWVTAAAGRLSSQELTPAATVGRDDDPDDTTKKASALMRLTNPARPRPRSAGQPMSPPAATGKLAEPWQAEADWWRRVEADGQVLLRGSQADSGPVLGAVAVMAADARRVRAALGVAARGGVAVEAYDALA